jgi:hypothetical protein
VSEAPIDTIATLKRWRLTGRRGRPAAERHDARLDRDAADAERER